MRAEIRVGALACLLLAAVSLASWVPVARAQPGATHATRASRATELRARGDAHLAAGDRGSAIGWYRDALAIDPGDGASYAALGRIYLDRGSLGDARAAFEAGVQRAPDHAPVWLGLAETLERMGSAGDAAAALRGLSRRLPRDAAVWRARAELARRRGAWSEALGAYRAIVALAAEGAEVDPAVLADAERSVVALRFLVGTLDPVRRESASAVRRALAR